MVKHSVLLEREKIVCLVVLGSGDVAYSQCGSGGKSTV